MASENMKAALVHILEADRLVKAEWDSDGKDHRAAGCYKVLNAISQVITEDDNKAMEKQYVFSRLMQAISLLSDSYGITFADALQIGGAPYFINK
ncbi:MAG: hypothetical protein WCT36_04870 [Candidatus Gracilibacteria bacterium]|jgi:hypothetical protein